MRTIEMLAYSACDEAKSSKEYAESALEYKISDPELSRFFYELANTEHEHGTKFMNHMDRRINELRNGVNFDDEAEDWFVSKRRNILARLAEAKRYIDMYR